MYQQHSGIYVIALDSLENMSVSSSEADETTQLYPYFRNISSSATLHIESRSALQSPSCLQVTDSALWFTWDHYGRGHGFVDIQLDGMVVRRPCMLTYFGHLNIAEITFISPAHRVATVVCISLMPDDVGSPYLAAHQHQ
jgi:hypothetical protein